MSGSVEDGDDVPQREDASLDRARAKEQVGVLMSRLGLPTAGAEVSSLPLLGLTALAWRLNAPDSAVAELEAMDLETM